MLLTDCWRAIFEFLRRESVLRLQLLVILHGGFTREGVKRGYSQMLHTSIRDTPAIADHRCARHTDRRVNRTPQKGANQQERQGDNTRNDGPHEDEDEDQLKVYSLDDVLWYKIYSRLTTGYMVYVVARTLARGPLESLISLANPPLEAHCYLPGAFVVPIYRPLSSSCACIFSIFHLAWRLSQTRAFMRPLRLGTIMFLLQTGGTIERHIRMFGGPQHSQSQLLELVQSRGRLTYLNMFLHSILYYRVEHKPATIYRLRPNRSLASHRRLGDDVARITRFTTSFFCLLIAGLGPLILYDCLSDRQYLVKYPNCDPPMERCAREGQIGFWSVGLWSVHRTCSMLFDLAENAIVWLDSAIAVYLNLPLVYLLHTDILNYWRHTHVNISNLVAELEQDTLLRPHHYSERRYGAATGAGLGSGFLARGGHTCYGRELAPVERRHLRHQGKSAHLEQEILCVQAKANDFFRQLSLVNELVSQIIFLAINLWLVGWAFVMYISLIYTTRVDLGYAGFAWRLNRAAVYILITTWLSPLFLITLHHRTAMSYRKLVSLMALDRSQHKAKFLGLLEYYTARRATYTVIQGFHYEPSLYLSIIGWSVSILFLIESLLADKRWSCVINRQAWSVSHCV